MGQPKWFPFFITFCLELLFGFSTIWSFIVCFLCNCQFPIFPWFVESNQIQWVLTDSNFVATFALFSHMFKFHLFDHFKLKSKLMFDSYWARERWFIKKNSGDNMQDKLVEVRKSTWENWESFESSKPAEDSGTVWNSGWLSRVEHGM